MTCSVEAKIDMSNTQGISCMWSLILQQHRWIRIIISTMYALPYWAKGGAIKTPDGKTGTAIAPDEADKNTEIDNDTKYGSWYRYVPSDELLSV